MVRIQRLAFFLLWLLTGHAVAQDEGHLRFLKYKADYRVNADATYTVMHELAFRLLTESALVGSGKMPISYSGKLEEAEVLEAYTLKKNGQRIHVEPGGIQTQQGQLAAGYGVSQADQRTMMITFPQLEVGDTIVYRYQLTQKESVFPGQFYASGAYARSIAWDAIDISIDTPEAMVLQVETVKMERFPDIVQDGRRQYRWEARNLPVTPSESSSVDLFPSTPHFIASTFKDWAEFSQAYEARAKEKAVVTPAIAQMADQITQNITEPREQARLLYDWVSKNIRYVATWIGAEGWVPHTAESVLNNRYGDCKDHVVLLEALLAAKGIASSTVMINSDKTSYSLPSVVYPVFNHVITYLPAFDLYVDSTAGSSTPFGVMPISDADKPVVHTVSFDQVERGSTERDPTERGPVKRDPVERDPVRRTPMLGAAQFAAKRLTQFTLSEDGEAVGEFSITAVGAAAIDLRDIQQSIGKHKEADWVRELLDKQHLEGEGTVAFEESADGSVVTLRLSVRIRNFMAFAENGVVPFTPLLVGPIAFDHLRGVYNQFKRTLPYWCPAWSLEDRYEIRMPKNLKLIRPKGRTINEAGFSYASRYDIKDDMLTVVRHLSIERSALACRPAEYKAAKAVVLRIDRDLRAQVIYQSNEQSNEKNTDQVNDDYLKWISLLEWPGNLMDHD